MRHVSRACTPSIGQSSSSSADQRRGWWPLRLGGALSTANQEERLRAAQFERFLLGAEQSTPATDDDVQLFQVKFLRPGVRSGEPESFLRVTHLPSGRVWQTKRSLDDWLRLEDAVEAESQALDTLREQSEERSLSSGELPRTLADALETAGLHPFEPPPAKQALRARRDVPLKKVLEDVKARLYELLQDEELGRCGTLQRFLGVQSPEMPSQVLIKKLQPTAGETVFAELEVTMCEAEDDGQPWAAATHVVAAVSGMVHSQGRHEKFEYEPWFSNVAALTSPEAGVRIGFHGLRPDVAVEFEVRSVNAVGYSAPVLIRTFTPQASESRETLPEAESRQALLSAQRWSSHQNDGSTALSSKETAEVHRQQGAAFLGIDIGTGDEEGKHPPAPNIEESSAADHCLAAPAACKEEPVEKDAACEPTAPEIVFAQSDTFAGDLLRHEPACQRHTSKTLVESVQPSTLQVPAGKLQACTAPALQDVYEEPEEDFADACSSFSKEEPEDTSRADSLIGLGADMQGQPESTVPDAAISAAEQMRIKLAARRNSDDFLEERRLVDAPEIAGDESSDAPEVAGADGRDGGVAAPIFTGSPGSDGYAAPTKDVIDGADASASTSVASGTADDESRRMDAETCASTEGSSGSAASGAAVDEKDNDQAKALSASAESMSESLHDRSVYSTPQAEARIPTSSPTEASDISEGGSAALTAPTAPPFQSETEPAKQDLSEDQLIASQVSAMAKPAATPPASATVAAAVAKAGGSSPSAHTQAADAVVAGNSAEGNCSQPQKPVPEPAPLRPGCVVVAGFQVKRQLLPTREEKPCDVTMLERSTEVARQRAAQATTLSRQQALRMLMGLNMDINAVVEKASAVQAWRRQHRLEEIQQDLMAQLAAPRSTPVQLPCGDTLQKMMAVDACALVTPDGCPVSIWHVGTADTAQAASVSADELTVWSCAFFEYVDLWISELSESTGCLAGHIQVFNLDGLNFWHVSNTALINKLKAALGAGGNYVEAISHMYVINSGRVFSMAWGIVKGLISPRTAGKITVANDVPKELLQVLGERSAKRLPAILRAARPAPVQRPPVTAAAPSC